MPQFAKIFEIEDTQVLVLKGWNDDEDLPQVEFITDFENGKIQINKGYETEEIRDEAFDLVDEKSAVEFLEQARKANSQFFTTGDSEL